MELRDEATMGARESREVGDCALCESVLLGCERTINGSLTNMRIVKRRT